MMPLAVWAALLFVVIAEQKVFWQAIIDDESARVVRQVYKFNRRLLEESSLRRHKDFRLFALPLFDLPQDAAISHRKEFEVRRGPLLATLNGDLFVFNVPVISQSL